MPEIPGVCDYCAGSMDLDEATVCEDCAIEGCVGCMPNGLCELCQDAEEERILREELNGEDESDDDDDYGWGV